MRRLKAEGHPKLEIQAAVAELKARKKLLEQREVELGPKEEVFDRNGLEDLLKRRFFYTQSFAIYGGTRGRPINMQLFMVLCLRCVWPV